MTVHLNSENRIIESHAQCNGEEKHFGAIRWHQQLHIVLCSWRYSFLYPLEKPTGCVSGREGIVVLYYPIILLFGWAGGLVALRLCSSAFLLVLPIMLHSYRCVVYKIQL